MSFLSPPKTVDPVSSSQNQLQFGKAAGEAQQTLNMVNQYNPFGSQTYTSDASSPSGYAANISLSPAQQAILDQQQQAKLTAGNVAQNYGQAAQNLTGSPGFGAAPNIDPSTLTNQMMGWGQQYMQPIFNQQQSNLDAKLQNQGINPGSEAYNNAQNLQSRNVNNAYQSLFLNAEPTAFSQAVQQYQLPFQAASSLQAGANNIPTPTTPNSSLVTPPQEQIQAPNYQQAAQNQFTAQQQQYQNMIQGLGQLTGIGMASNLTGGGGMFGGGWSSGGTGTGATFANGSQGMMGGVPFPIF